ncbi:hypothetical protein ONZ45_g6887 [Pleurotus djamor]|nr:hypothetical protein ONZ45_g6887 [Pleurotus djamor]
MPACTFSDHTLPITDISCGVGRYPTCRVLTSSLDHSVKLWDVASKSLLTTFLFPQAISCLAWDLTERMFFAGSEDGSIHQMNLFRQADDKGPAEAIGGAGVAGIIRVDEAPIERRKRLISVNQPVTCLTISMTSSLLLAGTSTGAIHIYDISSHQQLRVLNNHTGFSITHLATMLKPIDLIGHVNLSLSTTNTDIRDVIPVKPVAPFQRTRDAKAREAHEVATLLPVFDSPLESGTLEYTQEEFLRDHASFVQPTLNSPQSSIPAADSGSLQNKVADLEAEIRQLKEQLGKAKHINDTMWETVVQRVINGQPKDKEPSTNEAMDVDQAQQPKRRD